MENKVQQITDKIYREGVEKGQNEAQNIIADAQSQKDAILKQAQQDADKIIADAQKTAGELTKNTRAELKMYAGRAVEALKSEITNLITGTVAGTAATQTVSPEWLQKLMLTIATGWTADQPPIIQTGDATALTAYFTAHAKQLLDSGLKIEQISGRPATFAILPADRGYRIQFGTEEFEAWFREYLRPQLASLLFAQ